MVNDGLASAVLDALPDATAVLPWTWAAARPPLGWG
jgi:hypothetical protein